MRLKEFEVRPTPDDPRLSAAVEGIDHEGRTVVTDVVTERPLTLFLNGREIVTMMTIGDHPDLLAVGYLLNQGMLKADDVVTAIDHAEDIETIVVRTERQTDYEDKLKKKVQTSGCAQGTVFGDLMDELDGIALSQEARLRTSWLYALTRKINTEPSLYLKAGAIHGCVLCEADKPLVYMEDVGRHNAVDKVKGEALLRGIPTEDLVLLSTGRISSEMLLKAARMGVPVVASRTSPTEMAVALAEQLNVTVCGYVRADGLNVYAGEGIALDAGVEPSPTGPRRA